MPTEPVGRSRKKRNSSITGLHAALAAGVGRICRLVVGLVSVLEVAPATADLGFKNKRRSVGYLQNTGTRLFVPGPSQG